MLIWNCGGGGGGVTASWSVSDNAAWLTLSPTSGASAGEMDMVTVRVNISGMSAGSYSATITIHAPGAGNTPQTVPASLTITPSSTTTVRTKWDVHWRTLTPEAEWGPRVGTSEFPSTFYYDWDMGQVFGGYSDYIGFSATAVINMQREGPVRFEVGSDDGSMLYLDWEKIIDNWDRHSYRTKSVTVNLTRGKHYLTLHFYEWTGDAGISFDCDRDVLEWQEPGHP